MYIVVWVIFYGHTFTYVRLTINLEKATDHSNFLVKQRHTLFSLYFFLSLFSVFRFFWDSAIQETIRHPREYRNELTINFNLKHKNFICECNVFYVSKVWFRFIHVSFFSPNQNGWERTTCNTKCVHSDFFFHFFSCWFSSVLLFVSFVKIVKQLCLNCRVLAGPKSYYETDKVLLTPDK